MMFRTELHPASTSTPLSLAANVVTVGSCFSDVIGRKLENYRVNTLTNPFGTIFNPLSACKLLQICAGADVELADSFVENNGRWFSYDFHSSYSASSEEELYELLDEAIVKIRRFLKKADLLILTLGTANISRLNITGETVANCHKLPASNFTRETLHPEEIITAFAETHSLLRELNPNLRIVLTVSPVRHLKDTLELNSVSKSVLRLATHCLVQQLPETAYFPAYELLLDDLRDYRFYKEDLLHPTEMAEKYIWEKFSKAYFDQAFHTFSADWDTVLRAMAHRPFHPESAGHQAFVQQMLEKLRTLQNITDVSEQLAYFENQVIIPPVLEEPDEEDEEEIAEKEESIEAREIAAAAETPAIVLPDAAEITPEPVSEAALAETSAGLTLTEGGARKKRKKNRRKKKKPTEVAETPTEISGAGLGQAEAERIPGETTTESIAETSAAAAEVASPEGSTSPSRSAKKRSNRRKKKAQAAREAQTADQAMQTASEPSTGEVSQERPSEPTHHAEKGASENAPEMVKAAALSGTGESKETSQRPIKPARQRPAKKQKSEAKTEEGAPVTVQQTAKPFEKAIEISEGKGANSRPEKTAPKRTGKGKKPKMPDLFATENQPEAKAEPVTQTIAVPFMPASELETPETPKPAPKKPARRTSKAKAPAKTETKADEGKQEAEAVPVQAKKPTRKPAKSKVAPVAKVLETPQPEIGKKQKAAAKPKVSKPKTAKAKPDAKVEETAASEPKTAKSKVAPKAKKATAAATKTAKPKSVEAAETKPKTKRPGRKKQEKPEA